MGGYAVNPVIAGLINGTHLALAVKQQHLEQQAQQMQKQRQDRQAKVEDLQTRMGLLQSGAQPTQMSGAGPEVPNGATVHAPGATINGMEVGGSDQAAPRPVDPGRTVSYGGTSYYVPTPNEQFQQQLPILQAQANLKTQSDLATKSGEAAITHSYDNVQLPGIGTVNKAAIPFYNTQQTQAAENTRQDKSLKSQKDLTDIRESGANSRNAATNATSRRNTDVREAGENTRAANKGGADGGLTPNGTGVESRALAKLQGEEQDIHQRRLAIGNALNAQEGETYINPVTGKEEEMSTPRRKWLQGLMTSYDGKLAANQNAQGRAKDLLTRGKKQQQPAAADAAPPIPGTAAKAVPAGRVRVKDSKGNIGTIPASQLEDAKKAGYREVGG
jgi:hypothetical protein